MPSKLARLGPHAHALIYTPTRGSCSNDLHPCSFPQLKQLKPSIEGNHEQKKQHCLLPTRRNQRSNHALYSREVQAPEASKSIYDNSRKMGSSDYDSDLATGSDGTALRQAVKTAVHNHSDHNNHPLGPTSTRVSRAPIPKPPMPKIGQKHPLVHPLVRLPLTPFGQLGKKYSWRCDGESFKVRWWHERD